MQNFKLDLDTEELLGQLVDPVVLLDKSANILYFNPAFSRLSGYKADKIGHNLNDFIEDSFIPEKDRLLQKVLKTGSLQGIEANLKATGGKFIPLMVSAIRMEHKGKTLILLQIKDITEKQKILSRLAAGEARFKAAFDNAFDPVFITEITSDKKAMIRYVNQAACEQYGYSEEEFTTLTIDKIDDETGRKEIPKRIKRLLAGEAISFVTTHVRKDDSRFPCKVDTKIIKIEGKKYIYASHHDLTEQMAYENALAESEAKYHFLADNTFDWEYWLSPEGKYEYISPACKRITGYPQKDFLNNPSLTLEIIHPDDAQTISEHYQKEVDSPHGAFSAEFKIITADGESRWIQHHCFPIYDENEKYIGRRGVNRDITERKEAELDAAASKRKIENYMNMAPVLFFVLDKQGKVLFANQKVNDALGYDNKGLVGKNLIDLVTPDSQKQEAVQRYQSFVAENTEGLTHFEQKVLNVTGDIRWMAFHNAIIRDEITQELKVVVAAEDITEKKRILDLLKTLNQAVKEASEVIFMTDKKGFFTFVNPEFTRFYGYAEEEVLHKVTPRILKSESTAATVHEQLWKDLLHKKSVRLNYKNKTKSGKLVDVSGNIDPVLDDRGNITGFLCIQRDISERLRYEKLQQIVVHIANAAHTAENLHELFHFIKIELAQVLKTDNLLIAFYDQEKQKITLPFINEFENQNEIKETDFEKTFSAQVIKAEKPLLFRSDEMKQMIQSGRINVVGTLSKVWLGVPLKVDNKIMGLLVLQDYENEDAFNESDLNTLNFVAKQISISIERLKTRASLKQKEKELLVQNKEYFSLYQKYKTQNEELIISKEKAEESDRLKSEFLLNMSHEVRTPLNAILGFSSLMEDDDLTKKDRNEYARIIINSSQQLLKIIDEILEISRLQTHEVKFVEKSFKINQLMMELFDEYNRLAGRKGIPLYLKKGLDDDESEFISDRRSLKVILQKLLDNAFKYTVSGHVELGYTIEKNQLIFFVKDTGIGIRTENQDLIFKRFSQEEKELTEKTGGLGLGLSIALEYAHLLKGDISLESERGKGSSFYVKIPLHPAKSVNSGNAKKTEDKPLILVVEDDEINYRYLEILLKTFKKNIHVHHEFSGEDAVSFCKKHPELNMVLMDIKLPEMSGLEATRLIKELYPDLPVIAQTAYSQEIDKKAARDAGCNDFISKPINKDEFYEIMARYCKDI